MKFREMNDDKLGQILLVAVKQERKLTSQILELLREVEDRKLFAKRGYPSLFAYCTEYLGYSESSAQRRISSMRLLREVPQVKEKVQSGDLSLSNVSQAARFFRQEKKIKAKTYEPNEKAEILESLTGKTQKEAERQLIKISPEPFKKVDKERAITEDLTEIRFTLNKETLSKLNRLRELKPHMTTSELLDWLLSRCLKQIDPIAKPKKAISSDSTRKKVESSLPQRHPVKKSIKPKPLRRPPRRDIKRQVWEKAQACCQYRDHKTGKACQSRLGLEIDHIRPLSLGGTDIPTNLRLLCREHHRLLTAMSFA